MNLKLRFSVKYALISTLSLSLILIFFLTATGGENTRVSLNLKEISLGKINPGMVPETLQFSLKANRVAYAVKSGEKYFMVIDGVAGKEYDGLHMPNSIFSPDGKTAVYGAWQKGKAFIVVNGQEGQPYWNISLITYSPDGKKIAYWAAKGEDKAKLKGAVVLNGKEGSVFDWIGESTPGPIGHSVRKYAPVFSPDSLRLAYIAVNGEKELVVVDSQNGQSYEAISSSPIFSPDSKKVAFIARKNGKWLVVVDGNEGKPYEQIENLLWSPDGQKIAYIAFHNGKELVVVNGTEGPEYQIIDRMEFSPDGQHLAYAADIGQKQVLVVDGKESKQYDMINHFVFSPDSRHLAYSALLNQKETVVVDGKELTSHQFVVSLGFSPDGKKVIYTGRDGMNSVDLFLNGQKVKSFEEIITPWIFSPDGQRLAYWVRKSGGVLMIIDGVEGPQFDFSNSLLFEGKNEPVFSPDSRHLAYVAVRGNKELIVVDGVESHLFDKILSRVEFDSPEVFHFLAINNNEIFKVEGSLAQTSGM